MHRVTFNVIGHKYFSSVNFWTFAFFFFYNFEVEFHKLINIILLTIAWEWKIHTD